MEREPAGPNPDDRPATALLSDPDAVTDELDRLEFAVDGYDRLPPPDEYAREAERQTALRPFREEFILRSGERLVFEADEESRDDLHGGVYFLQRAEELTPVDAQEQA